MTLYRETGGHDWCREHEGFHGSQCTFVREEVTIDYVAAFQTWWRHDHILNDQERLVIAIDAALRMTEDVR